MTHSVTILFLLTLLIALLDLAAQEEINGNLCALLELIMTKQPTNALFAQPQTIAVQELWQTNVLPATCVTLITMVSPIPLVKNVTPACIAPREQSTTSTVPLKLSLL
jgi:hypothetical protein